MTPGFASNYPATRTWRCDNCGGAVSVDDGYVIWNSRGKDRDFRIIHQSKCDDKSLDSSRALSEFVGVDGIASLLSLLTVGPLARVSEGGSPDKDISLSDFADLFRRLHVPHYERARQYFDDPRVIEFVGGWNERAMYMPSELAEIAAVGAKRSREADPPTGSLAARSHASMCRSASRGAGHYLPTDPPVTEAI